MSKEEKDQEEEGDARYIARSVYIPDDLLDEMDEYKEAKGFGTRSEMLRRAFFVLKKVFPLDSETSQQKEKGLFKRLDSVEQDLEEMRLKQQVDKKEKMMVKKRQAIIRNGTVKTDTEELERVRAIRNDITELLREYGPLKDFVLMDKLAEQYERGEIWGILMELHEEGIVKNKKDKWDIENG